MSELYFDNITQEIRGHTYPGKLRLKLAELMFKNESTGKVDHFSSGDIASAQWINRAAGQCLRLKLRNDSVHRYDGFGEIEAEKLSSYFKKNFNMDVEKREISYKGFNWGDVVFEGNVLEFVCKNALAFDVPLSNISNAASNKNEVILEFHPNDDAELCLSEMRFHTPSTETDKDGAATEIYNQVIDKADIIQVTGDSLVEFKDISYLQPRGRYDVKLYNTFIHLHGKSFDYKIPKNTIIRFLLLPHPDNRQMFFAAQVDPPLKHGQTRYHIIVMVFEKDKDVEIELTATDEYLQKNYEGKLTPIMVGPEYDLFARLCKNLYGLKITGPGLFKSKNGGSAIACSHKTYVGLLYPLERGFIFVPRPPVSIRFEEIANVNFSRGTGALRSFDFEIETRMGVTHTFVSIERDEYHKLYDYVRDKRLSIKNIEDNDTAYRAKMDEIWSSSDESHDAYLNQVKAEGRERTAEHAHASSGTFAGADFSDDDEDDEDFNPPEMDSSEDDIAEEYDSNAESSDSDSSGGSKSESGSSSKRRHHRKENKHRPSHHKRHPSAPRKSESKKSKKDPNAPVRPSSAYIIWFNENRQQIKNSLGDSASVTSVAKAAGEKWNNMSADLKARYQAQADKQKEKYEEEMKVYKAKIASGEIFVPKGVEKGKKKEKSKTATHKKSSGGVSSSHSGAFKSAEYVEESESSSSSPGGKKGGGSDNDDSLSDMSD
nr:fact complex subunit ssrp1 [Hymenolepis microstoma]